MSKSKKKNLLEGITLEAQLTELVAHFGWEYLGQQIRSKLEQIFKDYKAKAQHES